MSRFDPDLPFGESRWRTGQKTFPPMCPPHRHPLQQRRVGHGHDAPVLGTKPQGHHSPAPWAAADGQRHPDSDVGYRNGHGALHLRPRSRAWLPSPSTRNRISAPVGPTPIRGRRRRQSHCTGFRLSKGFCPTTSRIYKISAGKPRVSASSTLLEAVSCGALPSSR